MEIINLPDALSLASANNFSVFDYKASQESIRQMVALKHNTFSFLLEGSKEVFSDKTVVSIQNSDFLLMKAGHCLMTEKLPNPNSDYRSLLFFFSTDALLAFAQKHAIRTAKETNQESVYAFKYDTYLKSFVKGLVDVEKLDPKIQSKLLAVKFEELLLYLVETNSTGFFDSLLSSSTTQELQHFVQIVETNKLNKLTLKELSFLAHMSLSTFKRTFEKHFQCSPSKWFQEKRLEHAAFLLKNKSKRASDIFEEIGYETLSNFIHAFKRKFGATPKQYQNT